ncbi:LysR family transcriptional regulator [Rhodococcus sp. IEGM 1381]|uniref:LysR family transcriptional regulator n=1 Tax=Rhodococcus sp. IEGM 1381 TaxID=3047085 RepID=UPI0024B82132|nr:LysR family transcriptional regulator [Rhodococcus sp. IEGM 1381]MDI9896334.1 LysR family transcriptional regulator [Rhodococcus sp. IEGM 1381]
MIDPVALRALLAVHDTGSVTAAASLLGYTSPNITQHLRKLERKTGAKIVERVGRGVVITSHGQSLVARARPLIDGLEQLEISITGDLPSGRIRVAAFPTALRGLLLPAVGRLRSDLPDLDLVPVEADPASALDALGVGRVDAVIAKSWGTTKPREDSRRSFERIALGRDQLDAVVPVDHRFARRRCVALRDLAHERWAITPMTDPFGPWIAGRAPELLEPIVSAYNAQEFESLIRFVEVGLAITVVPRLGRGTLPASVAAVPLSDDDAYRDIHLYVRQTAGRSRTVLTLVDRFRQDLAG